MGIVRIARSRSGKKNNQNARIYFKNAFNILQHIELLHTLALAHIWTVPLPNANIPSDCNMSAERNDVIMCCVLLWLMTKNVNGFTFIAT